MPRPKKVAIQDIEIETELVDHSEIESELISDLEAKKEFDSIVESIVEEIPEPIALNVPEEVENVRRFRVYEKGNFVEEVADNSKSLQTYLLKNKAQLENHIATLCQTTTNDEDLVLFNVNPFDNRTYKSLEQYYFQNGLAPKPPIINDWMTYYKSKYPLATEEELAINVFGPLDYSFEIIE